MSGRPGTTHPDGPVDEHRRRRRAAEAAADVAEAAAVEAAALASVAIAAAARAAAAAEEAAETATRAAAAADAAVAAERHAVEQAHAADDVSANKTTTVALSAVAKPVVQNGNGTPPNGRAFPRQQVAGPAAVPSQGLPSDEAAVAGAATMTISATPLRDAPGPAVGGRAARRRAQEAADATAAVAREANRDPDTYVFNVERDSGPDADMPAAGNPLTALLGRLRGRPGSRMVLVVAAAVGVILVAAVVVGLTSVSRGSSTAAVVEPAPSTAAAASPTSAAADPDAAVDPTSPKAVAFLKALRAADVPTSDSGQSETEAAEVICQQLSKGAESADLVRALPAVLPTVNARQAKSVVSIAQKDYCG